MIKVILIGAGNVAKHLFDAFHNTENVQVTQVYNRSEAALNDFSTSHTTTSFSEIKEADVYLVSVKDDAVQEVIQQLSAKKGIVAHTSGSVPLLDIAKKNGVFYPLQTFSKNTAVNFAEIPLCLEAHDERSYEVLKKLAQSITPKVYPISTEQRKSLHLSAVFVCNFVNHLYGIGEDLCRQNHVPFDILHLLIKETARKATLQSPESVQTGPAKRNDQKTINSHLSQLNKEDYKEIYKLLTHSIQVKHGKKL